MSLLVVEGCRIGVFDWLIRPNLIERAPSLAQSMGRSYSLVRTSQDSITKQDLMIASSQVVLCYKNSWRYVKKFRRYYQVINRKVSIYKVSLSERVRSEFHWRIKSVSYRCLYFTWSFDWNYLRCIVIIPQKLGFLLRLGILNIMSQAGHIASNQSTTVTRRIRTECKGRKNNVPHETGFQLHRDFWSLILDPAVLTWKISESHVYTV